MYRATQRTRVASRASRSCTALHSAIQRYGYNTTPLCLQEHSEQIHKRVNPGYVEMPYESSNARDFKYVLPALTVTLTLTLTLTLAPTLAPTLTLTLT